MTSTVRRRPTLFVVSAVLVLLLPPTARNNLGAVLATPASTSSTSSRASLSSLSSSLLSSSSASSPSSSTSLLARSRRNMYRSIIKTCMRSWGCMSDDEITGGAPWTPSPPWGPAAAMNRARRTTTAASIDGGRHKTQSAVSLMVIEVCDTCGQYWKSIVGLALCCRCDDRVFQFCYEAVQGDGAGIFG